MCSRTLLVPRTRRNGSGKPANNMVEERLWQECHNLTIRTALAMTLPQQSASTPATSPTPRR